MQIDRIAIRGYRSLAAVDVPLGSLNVVIGPNGVGKSSLLDVFSFFSAALGRREALGRLLSQRGGISRLLTLGRRESIEVAFTTRALPASKRTAAAPMHYAVELNESGIGHSIGKELLTHGHPPVPLIEREGRRMKVWDAAAQKLRKPDLASPVDELVLAQVPRTLKEAEWFRSAFAQIHLHEAIPVAEQAVVRRPQTLEPTDMLVAPGGQNLFSVLYQLRQEEPDCYERILDVLRAGYPGFDRLDFPVVAAGQVMLAWYQQAYKDRPFYANELSAGTLRFLHLVTLLLTPQAPTLILIDEPEDSLHPELVRLLAELLLEAAERTQLIVATQSPALLRWLQPEHVIVADAKDGTCTLTPATELNLTAWLADYTLDRLWQNGQLGGRS